MQLIRPLLVSLLLAALLAAPAQAAHPKAKRKQPEPPAPAQLAGEIISSASEAALLLDGAKSAQGALAMLEAASQAAPALAPKLVTQDLSRAVGVDPLGPGDAAGLSPDGPRALVAERRGLAFTAPVADEAKARAALQAWLAQLGPVRPTRGAPLKGPLASGSGDQVRAGMIAPVAGSLRWISASGRNAAAQVSALAHVGRKQQDNQPLGAARAMPQALLAVPGPLRLWVRGEGLLLGTLASLDASPAGLRARGLILPRAPDAKLLEGHAPPAEACDGQPLFCARAAPGPALRELAPLFARELIGQGLLGAQRDAIDQLVQSALATAKGPLLLRVEGLQARALGEPENLLAALPSSIASGSAADKLELPANLPAGWSALPPPQNGVLLSSATRLCAQAAPGALWLSAPCSPLAAKLADAGSGEGENGKGGAAEGREELAARLDTQALARSLSPLSALDALRGPLAAGAFAGKLLYGELLARSGPVDFAARPAASPEAALQGALELEASWPLSLPPSAK